MIRIARQARIHLPPDYFSEPTALVTWERPLSLPGSFQEPDHALDSYPYVWQDRQCLKRRMGCPAMVRWFFRAPPLTGNARRTYCYHLLFALFDAVTGGVIATAPFIALKQMGAPDWQLGLKLTLSGLGMLATLYLSHWMAVRRKMPFVFLPGLVCVASTAAMALTENSLLFLFFSGLGLMFNTITRPAVAAIVRTNYPAEHRGQATGEIRRWTSLVFLLTVLGSAVLLDFASEHHSDRVMAVIHGLLLMATLSILVAYLLFRQIRVEENLSELTTERRPPVLQSFRDALAILVRDARYRSYILGCFAFGFAATTYVSFVPAFLNKDLQFSYVQCVLFFHVIPAIAAFLVTGQLGRWFDRVGLSVAWAWVRFGWGLDPLLLAASTALVPVLGPGAVLVAVLARVSLGSVQGGYWILWWQIGVAYYAKPGADTSRYQGILVFVDGITKMTAPALGAWILMQPGSSRELLFLVGGMGVLLSGAVSFFQARHERRDAHLLTTAEYEAQFDEPL